MAFCGSHRTQRGTSPLRYAALTVSLAAALLFPSPALAQKLDSLPVDPSSVRVPELKDHFLIDRLPEKPTVPPAVSISLDQLDYPAPNRVYLGHRYTMASLDFLDDNHLLFTFRVPGLIRRVPGQQEDNDERHVRALLISLPSGTVQSEALWTLHDRDPYLWGLHDGHFLLRDRNTLFQGDASLQLKPVLRFPGPLLTVALDPSQQYLVTNSREPLPQPAKTADSSGDSTDDDQTPTPEPEFVLRILRRDSGQVLGVDRVRALAQLPINSQGYANTIRGIGSTWVIAMTYFKNTNTDLTRIESACMPKLEFLSDSELLATACTNVGGFWLTAITTSGKQLWRDSTSAYTIWPILRRSASGLRFMRETLAVTREIGTYWALDPDDIKAQRIRVFDSATGNVVFEATADPVLDAGGNAALSPSGRRVAVLTNGALQVFNLPAPPPMPNPDAETPKPGAKPAK